MQGLAPLAPVRCPTWDCTTILNHSKTRTSPHQAPTRAVTITLPGTLTLLYLSACASPWHPSLSVW